MKLKLSIKFNIVIATAVMASTLIASQPVLAHPATFSSEGPTQATAAPSTPSNFRLMDRAGAKLYLNWDWVSGGVGALHYELSYADKTLVLSQYYPGYQLDVSGLDLGPGHSYTLRLWAIDEAGNRSGAAQLVFETTPPTPPRNLTQLSTRDGYPDVISYAFSSDNAGPIRTYEVFLNGARWGTISAASSEFSLYRIVSEAYKNIPRGPAALQLRALDQSLNPSQLSDPLTVVFP